MGKRNIHINQIQIRLRGVSAKTARNATSGLGHEVMNQMSQKRTEQKGAIALDAIEIPAVRVANGIRGNEMRGVLAEHIASAIEKRLGET